MQKSIEEIKRIINTALADCENKNIKQLYNDFVYPVIALQDGVWITAYHVKKIFLAVYYILKSLVEKDNAGVQLFGVSTRSYGAAINNFLASLKTNRKDLVNKVSLYKMPEIKI